MSLHCSSFLLVYLEVLPALSWQDKTVNFTAVFCGTLSPQGNTAKPSQAHICNYCIVCTLYYPSRRTIDTQSANDYQCNLLHNMNLMREAKLVLSHKPHKKLVNTSLKLNISCLTPKPMSKVKPFDQGSDK